MSLDSCDVKSSFRVPFGHLFGFVGVLIALPVSAVLVVAVRRLRETYVESELFTG